MEVIKESFEVRMTIRKLVANVKRLDRRITEIENKQNATKYSKAAIHDRSGKRWSKR
jgi:hypothetical protein